MERVWITIAEPTATTDGHELSPDDGATRGSITPHVGDRVVRVTAPDVRVDIDSTTVNVRGVDGNTAIDVDLLVTNAGSVELHGLGLQWPLLPDGATLTNLAVVAGVAWVALDGWW